MVTVKKMKKILTQADINDFFDKVDNEGFDYYFTGYGPDLEVMERMGFNMKKVHAFIKAHNDLEQEFNEIKDEQYDEDFGMDEDE